MAVRRVAWGSLWVWGARLAAALLGVLLFCVVAARVSAATVTATVNDESTNTCATSGTGTCSLRDAVVYANANDSTAIAFNLPAPSTITLTGGALTRSRTTGTGTTITGPGANLLAVDGSNNGSVFAVNPGVTASISGLTIQHGSGTNTGGTTAGGGIVINTGTLTVTNSTLTNNSVTDSGGGIFNFGGTLTVTNSTFSGNSASGSPGGFGGGIGITGGTVTVTNSTFSGNSASNTIVTKPGGGIGRINGTVTLTNTIVANSTGGDLFANTGSFGGDHNLIDDAATAGGFTDGTNGNIVGHPALLGMLGNSGGPTQTIPLLTGSLAIAHGDPAVCTQTGTSKVNTLDQRGVTRPATLCAIGAYESLLSAIGPTAGATGGGMTVYLAGAGFVAGASVTVGGAACTNVQVTSSTLLQCVTGVHGAGAADAVVTVSSQTGTLVGAYTYGVVNPLPTGQTSGSPSGSPGALPSSRPTGPTQPSMPSPLPSPRQ